MSKLNTQAAKCRLCRKEGIKLFLKEGRCFSVKCPLERKGAVIPGVHGKKRLRKLSSYGVQLREKQKAKRIYGISERQFKNYFQKAALSKTQTGLRLLQLLELRLDNIIFRAGLALSRSNARQMINHGFVVINGKSVDIPSFQVKPNDLITLNTKGLKLDKVKKALTQKIKLPLWLQKKAAVVKIDRLPLREELEADINETLIIEFYSR